MMINVISVSVTVYRADYIITYFHLMSGVFLNKGVKFSAIAHPHWSQLYRTPGARYYKITYKQQCRTYHQIISIVANNTP